MWARYSARILPCPSFEYTRDILHTGTTTTVEKKVFPAKIIKIDLVNLQDDDVNIDLAATPLTNVTSTFFFCFFQKMYLSPNCTFLCVARCNKIGKRLIFSEPYVHFESI